MTDLQILAWTVALGLAQLVLSVAFNVAGRGLVYGIGPRDEPPRQLGVIASRLERAYKNYMESFPFFAAAVLLGHAANPGEPALLLGGQIYLWARVFYVPAYVVAIPGIRTACWTVSIMGIVIVLVGVWSP
jgi:uncharacterized MAPEG superfamily protein